MSCIVILPGYPCSWHPCCAFFQPRAQTFSCGVSTFP
uniref:Uncharacterized protein n=1 Tax=Rhizophora mucronata TaxID=61149 RepID=A0A2P2JN37_RHIMU